MFLFLFNQTLLANADIWIIAREERDGFVRHRGLDYVNGFQRTGSCLNRLQIGIDSYWQVNPSKQARLLAASGFILSAFLHKWKQVVKVMDFGILGWSVIKMIKLTSVCCQRKIKHFGLEFTGKYYFVDKRIYSTKCDERATGRTRRCMRIREIPFNHGIGNIQGTNINCFSVMTQKPFHTCKNLEWTNSHSMSFFHASTMSSEADILKHQDSKLKFNKAYANDYKNVFILLIILWNTIDIYLFMYFTHP